MPATILVADADPFNIRLLSELCATLGHEVITAADGGSVLDAVARERPQLVIMDVSLPVMDGFKVLRILKEDSGLNHLPVLLVTAEDDIEGRRKGLELGAEDYLTKPYRTFEIEQRLRNVLRLQAARGGSLGLEEDTRSPSVDPTTGAGTLHQLHITLDYEFTRAARYGHPLSCIVVRCNNYEKLVGGEGSDTAHLALLPLAGALRSCIRGVDHMFRSAAGEFTILLPETDESGCDTVVGRLHNGLGEEALFDAALEPRPDVSVGHTTYPKVSAADGEALWRAAGRH